MYNVGDMSGRLHYSEIYLFIDYHDDAASRNKHQVPTSTNKHQTFTQC